MCVCAYVRMVPYDYALVLTRGKGNLENTGSLATDPHDAMVLP